MRHGAIVGVAVAACGALPAMAAAPARLRFTGIGPLKVGMTLAHARATGWIAHPTNGCELAAPRPVVYRLDGRRAPAGLSGEVQFDSGRLSLVVVSAGARTALGTQAGTPWRTMVRRYSAAGFTVTAKFDTTFQQRFVDVSRRGHLMLQATTKGRLVADLAVPNLAFCE
ncbi:MAG: hypothetical protein U0Y82_11500 [Thermoleophilia bacterium]